MRSNPTHWDLIRKELRPKFAAAGLLETCELGWENCLMNRSGQVPKVFQTFAHSLRRRKIDMHKKYEPDVYEKLIREVIRACTKCHEELDDQTNYSQDEAAEIVRQVINKRKRQP